MALRLSTRVVLALASLLGACADRTSLYVEVTSDFVVPDDVNQLRFVIVGDVEGMMVERTFDLTTDWPHSLSVRPGQIEDQGVVITVEALHDGAFVARRVVRSAFERGEQVRVAIHIDAACRGIECQPGIDCVNGMCEDEPPIDAGMRDAGMMPPADAGCMAAEDCDDAVNCTIDTCDNGSCRNEPDNGFCADGFECDAMLGCPPRVCANDAECNDGVACNGVEVCAEMVCTPGPAIDCFDDDPCTADVCDEPMRGVCAYTTIDMDGDGYGDAMCPEAGGVPATDCNDANPDSFPGAPEICNGVDDDCNTRCDETFACCRGEIGSCMTGCGTTGTRVCALSCAWDVCSPPAEACNGRDDNCVGGADEIFDCVLGATETCVTACGSTGMRTCQDGCTWSACMPPAETCSGQDDDCDMNVDEGFGCVAGRVDPCPTSCGTTGSRTCDASCNVGATCVPPPEGCNGADDDCDTRIDESSECTPGTMQDCMTTCGTMGRRTCSATCVYGACTPPAEVCNGADDDCDGLVDDGFTCVVGATGSCTTSCMNGTGTRTCNASCNWGACTPPAESCDARDNDCDGMCDETFACCAGQSGSCMTSCMTMGSRTCSAACGWSVCSPPAETCNGIDDDCNGGCDDTFACCANRPGPCTTTCGSTGTRMCQSDCTWNSCVPPAEVCNAMDDDCDGTIDNGFACIPGSVGNCTTTCGSTGTQFCDATCNFGVCMPPTESCNGVDDDCDGTTDEGCGACSSCTGATTVSLPGGRFDVTLGAHAETGSCGGAGGSEAYLTITLTATSDLFIATHQTSSIDTVIYVRDCTCRGTELTGACNDNADGRTSSRLRLTNVPAGTYNIIIDTKAPTSGTVSVDVYTSTPGTESDRCGNPTFLAAGTTTLAGTTCGFNQDYTSAISSGCPFGATGTAQERVFFFYVPTARTVAANGCVSGNSYDQTFYIRSVCTDGALTNQLACNDDGCGGPLQCDRAARSTISTTLQPGLYYLFVDGYPSVACPCGNYSISLTGI